MENAVAIRSTYVPSESEFQTLQVIARNAAASGLYSGIGSEPKIFMILLAARELGVPPLQALNGGIWNIQGKIEISARLMNAMIRRAGHSIIVKHCDETKCVLEGKRADNGDSFTAQFTIEDAKKAGLASRSTWRAYAEDMLYSRAMSRLARRLFSDVIGTAYVEGEIRDAKCEVISSISEERQQEERKEEPNPEEDEANLASFLSEYAVDDHSLIVTYLQKYSSHWKKSISQAINDYSNKEKFLADFSRWKKREETKQVA
jgi:hypothetical protein